MTSHRNSFDIVRLLGALLVMIGHAYLISNQSAPAVGTVEIHTLGVCIFFVISGYLITQSWLSDPRWPAFVARRALRIFPGLAVVSTVTALLIGAAVTTEPVFEYFCHGWTWRYILSNSALVTVWSLPGVFENLPLHGQANGSLWTLPIEFGLYLLTPIIAWPRHRLGRWKAAPAFVLAMIVITAANRHPEAFSFNFRGIDAGRGLALAPYFWVGGALYLVDLNGADDLLKHRLLIGALMGAMIWGVVRTSLLAPLGVVSIALLTLIIGLSPWLYLDRLRRLGDLSYGTYLWAFPLQQLVMERLAFSPVLNLVVTIPITLLVAYGSWHLIERQALRFKPHR